MWPFLPGGFRGQMAEGFPDFMPNCPRLFKAVDSDSVRGGWGWDQASQTLGTLGTGAAAACGHTWCSPAAEGLWVVARLWEAL